MSLRINAQAIGAGHIKPLLLVFTLLKPALCMMVGSAMTNTAIATTNAAPTLSIVFFMVWPLMSTKFQFAVFVTFKFQAGIVFGVAVVILPGLSVTALGHDVARSKHVACVKVQ